MPQRGPESQCGWGVKAKLRFTPSSRITRFSLSSLPTGTEGWGRLGSSSSLSSSANSCWAKSAAIDSIFCLSAAPLALASSRASGVGALAISRDRRFWSAWMVCESFFSLRTAWSSASTASRSTADPSLAKPARTSSGLSLMSRMSSMRSAVYDDCGRTASRSVSPSNPSHLGRARRLDTTWSCSAGDMPWNRGRRMVLSRACCETGRRRQRPAA